MIGHNEATLRQIKAAMPDRSTWLSANAGSGKTKVLTDRVARLLLDQVDPQHILCLTYTKAAASEMQNRLFNTLGEWAMLPDEALTAKLQTLGHELVITNDTLNHARRLFARAIETPGGLKIQTIHSFCSALLRRFPLEAGVTPQFTEMEDRAATLLRAEIVEALASGPQADTLYTLARHHTGETLDELTQEIVNNRAAFDTPASDEWLENLFDLPPGTTRDSIAASVFLGGEMELLDSLCAALAASGPSDQGAGTKLTSITSPGFDCLAILENVFLTGPGAKEPFSAKIGSFPTKACRESNAALMPQLEALMARVETARAQRIALQAKERTAALHAFARVFLPAYEQAKLLRGWLDFDDLILKARDLLTDRKVADWVLFKLDGGLDHILVDEAQDTSPVQWQVIERLAQEFTSGQGTRPDTPRTIFVVGDKKQSIYSFQGADPREFDRMKSEFAARLSNNETPLQDMEMEFSFRSSRAILDTVDATFENHESSGFGDGSGHKAFKEQMPGRVDLWPLIEAPEKPEDPDWFDPVDVKAPDDPARVLAKTLAQTIKAMIGTPLPDQAGETARPIEAGDILILVRRRSALFHDVIRECKALGLPVAGADRLKVGAELAVKDLAALLSFLATPEDDLALATALRSPLFGWSEAQLYELAHDRVEKYLWAELRNRADDFPETMAILGDLRRQADYLRPYEIIERILIRHDGRRKLLARLGQEAEDGIDALLMQALAYERNAVDSLTGFLVWMETDDLEIKRQMDNAGNRIRVMTVHGAKGLESPVVILPDTNQWPMNLREKTAQTGGTLVWRMTGQDIPASQRQADDDARAAQRAERDRLLYVAMTRAEQWLIVSAAGKLGTDGLSWHDKVRAGLDKTGAVPLATEHGPGLRYQVGDWPASATATERPDDTETVSVPPYFTQIAPEPQLPAPPLSPSTDLGGAKALPGEDGLDEDTAKRRGRQIHLLLETLAGTSEAGWPDLSARILSQGEDAATGDELTALTTAAGTVLKAPALADIFTPDALLEVPVTARLDALNGARIHGIIDRLIVTPTHVTAIDYKTNAIVPATPEACPEGLLRQMGAYAHALQQLYPDREIKTALLWTQTAQLMHLPHDLVTAALCNTHIP
ncbi:double-strand break repair helicase AddA [Roseovarius sp.]|uniref:double-strand break repair helicase AddA n=1 Tax=Roseovarius sp. TaxID=1486281 RepID=UPI00261519CC|nr:double-strand break repair helicase AddA [Roseovarius sp.]MDM8165964.1 double-strand break repair helicase AddA [Roseovarius sp.]